MLICQENYGKNRDFFLRRRQILLAPQTKLRALGRVQAEPRALGRVQAEPRALGRVQAEPRRFERMQTKLASKDRIL